MNVVRQRSQDDNVVAALKNLVSILGLRISMSSIERVAYHPSYPSLTAVSDALYEWNVENASVRISAEQLHEASLPILVHLKKNNGHLAIVTQVTQESVEFLDPETGLLSESIVDFEKKWSGVAILLEAKPFAEESFKEKKQTELFTSTFGLVVTIVAAAMVLLPAFIFAPNFLFDYSLKFVGTLTCLVLVRRQFDPVNAPLQMFCKKNSNIDCNAVIKSEASKIFGLIHLSELGMLWFSGGFLTLLLTVVSGSQYPLVLMAMNLIGIPVAVFALLYQWRVLKRWCILCVIVSSIVLIEAVTMLFISPIGWGIEDIGKLLVGFGLPLIGWYLVRGYISKSVTIPTLERSLEKFRKSDRIFNLILKDSNKVADGNLSKILLTGNQNASISILFVSSLTCSPCRIAQQKLDAVLKNLGEHVKVDFRFSVDMEDQALISRVIRRIVAIGLRNSGDQAWRALTDWNNQREPDMETWAKKHALENSAELDQEVNALLEEQQEWFKDSQLPGTPIILINNRLYPDEYTLNDLQYHIRKISESVTEEIVIN